MLLELGGLVRFDRVVARVMDARSYLVYENISVCCYKHLDTEYSDALQCPMILTASSSERRVILASTSGRENQMANIIFMNRLDWRIRENLVHSYRARRRPRALL